jgi:16S rRNA (adenine1518-N6/adenine1519-N6)-dimethyltransferase
MKPVRAKKKLGQHFLTDLTIARRIAETLDFQKYSNIIEIGPGNGSTDSIFSFRNSILKPR